MYYAGLPANGSQSMASPGVDKPGIYMPAPGPYAPAPAGYPPTQPGLPPALATRFAAAPQAYAVVSNGSPAGYTTITPAYHSMPYSSLQGIPTSSHAYISAAQYPGMSYQTLAPRSAPSPYPTPVQAGAPLIAAGYSPMPGAIGAPTPRSYSVSAVPGYPPGYPLPGVGTAPYPGATGYGPPF